MRITSARDLQPGARYENATLDSLRVRDKDLTGIDLTDARLLRVTFSGVDLSDAIFSNAHLEDCRFTDCVMPAVRFNRATFASTLKRYTSGVRFEGCAMAHANLREARGGHITFTDTVLMAAHLDGAILDTITLERSILSDAHLSDASLTHLRASHTPFSRAVLLRTRLRASSLEDCELTDADLTQLNAQELLIQRADMQRARFIHAQFTRSCRFQSCNLADTTFEDADLRGLTLAACSTHGMSLIGARGSLEITPDTHHTTPTQPKPTTPTTTPDPPKPTPLTGPVVCAHCEHAFTRDTPDAPCPACSRPPQLADRYLLRELVGSGANGMTWRAHRLDDGAELAIKELSVRKIDALKTLELFEREARILASLDHPGIPRFIEVLDQDHGKHTSIYLVQSFIHGHTLEHELTTRRHDEREALNILAKLSKILTYLHNLSPAVVHRDIKPANIMRRTSDDSLVLIDFGSVRELITGHTTTGGSTIAGTFGFMAPEQFAGLAAPATDLYALGATAIALLSRQPLHTLLDHDNHLVWQPAVRVSTPTRDLLTQLLEPDPDARLSNATTLETHIQHILEREGPLVTTTTSSSRNALARHTRTRRRLSAGLVIGAILNLIVGATFGLGPALILTAPLLIGSLILIKLSSSKPPQED